MLIYLVSITSIDVYGELQHATRPSIFARANTSGSHNGDGTIHSNVRLCSIALTT